MALRLDGVRRLDGGKRRQWDRIKRDAPEVADFLAGVQAVFGRPAAVKVVLDGDVVVELGDLLPDQPAWDGVMRHAKYGVGWK